MKNDAPSEYNNPIRGRFNAAFFRVFDDYINKLLHKQKLELFSNLEQGKVLEIGPGIGANFSFYQSSNCVIALEPNHQMRSALVANARKYDFDFQLLAGVGEQIMLPTSSVDYVVSTLVLCTVNDPSSVLKEVYRVLKPGGKFLSIEHIAADNSPVLRTLQRVLYYPWMYLFEGCDLCRQTDKVIGTIPFSKVEISKYNLKSPFIPVNSQMLVVATK